MAPKKKLRKTLPKDIEQLLAAATTASGLEAAKLALAACEPDATGGYGAKPLLMFGGCSEELARWNLERGANVNAQDKFDYSPLHESARSRFRHLLTIDFLVANGANIGLTNYEALTPLHCAADGKHLHGVQRLLFHGANIDAKSTSGLTPLQYALQRLSNIGLVDFVPVAKALLAAGASSANTKDFVALAAKNFEFHRGSFARDSVEETAAACRELCELFGVNPPSQRVMHDGVSRIGAKEATWQKQHAELWDYLVPSRGPCATIQGEVIRISGRIGDEVHRNGGANWDDEYRKMAVAFCDYIAIGTPLSDDSLAELAAITKSRSTLATATARLAQFAVEWVRLNPTPIVLPTPAYNR